MMTGAPLTARRRALAGAAGLLWVSRHAVWLALGSWVAPAAAQPEPNAAVQRAKARLDAIDSLVDATRSAVSSTDWLGRRLGSLAADWPTSDADSAPAQAALQQLGAVALPALRAAQQAWVAAAAESDRAVLAHLGAVALVGTAAAPDRPAAMVLVDTRAAERRQAQGGYQRAGVAVQQALQTATDTSHAALTALDAMRRRREGVDAQLAQTASHWAELGGTWRALQARADAAARAGGLPAAALAGTGLQPARAAWARPAGAVAPPQAPGQATAPWRDWKPAWADADQASRARWLRQDAAGFVQRMVQAGAGGCADGANTVCGDWRAEQQALADELAMQQALLAGALARLQSAQAGADGLPAQLQAHRQALQTWRAGQAAAVAAATGPGADAVQAGIVAGQAALRRLEAARDGARQAWVAAWAAQYGSAPPPDLHRDSSALMNSMAAPPPAMASMFGQLDRHALHCMAEFDDEPAGFGAYTYVLVGTSVGRDSPGVTQRLQRLLSALSGLPPADEIPADKRSATNTFVVPAPQPTGQRPRLDYNLRLGQSLMSHVPPGLLQPGAARRALGSGNGPFLITLPGRLAKARADWPVLFADLSQVPEAVVVDVVRSYMGDLLGQFSVTRTAWQPPAAQQMALVLVRLVQGTGDLVQAVFPAAVAAPARP